GGAAQEVGEYLKFCLGVSGADLVERCVHSRVEAKHFGVALAPAAYGDRAAVGGVRVPVAGDPSAAFEPVQDAGQGGGGEPSPPAQGAGAERAVNGDQVEAFQVHVLEVKAAADTVVEQRQLAAQLAHRVPDADRQPPPAAGQFGTLKWYRIHMICFPYYMKT